MVKKKYADEQAIRSKIRELFAYRRLKDLLQISQLDKNKTFVTQLIEIQFQIYQLDAYLESVWELDEARLDACWLAIAAAVSKLNYSNAQIKELLKEIRAYERIEKDCRHDKWPTKVPFKEFYLTKSCDVRLIRHLIYQAHPALSQIWNEEAWTNYDLITEINDDLSDVKEDLATYNGNRFLISLLRDGTITTYKEYHKYLIGIISVSKVYFKKSLYRGDHLQLFEWTAERAIETMALLDKINLTPDLITPSAAYLLKKME